MVPRAGIHCRLDTHNSRLAEIHARGLGDGLIHQESTKEYRSMEMRKPHGRCFQVTRSAGSANAELTESRGCATAIRNLSRDKLELRG